MSIQDNTTALQELLNIANNLPEPDSGGVDVKTDSGNVSCKNATTTVTLGYKPDVVSITISGYPALTAVFSGTTSVAAWAGNDNQQTYPFICVTIKQTSTGFSTSGAYRINWSNGYSDYSGTGSYKAVKYT